MALVFLDMSLTYAPWWISGILFLAMGFAFVCFSLKKRNGERAPRKETLSLFRWTLLPLMAMLLLTAIRAYLENPRGNITLQYNLNQWRLVLNTFLWVPLFCFLLGFLWIGRRKRTWVNCLPFVCFGVADLLMMGFLTAVMWDPWLTANHSFWEYTAMFWRFFPFTAGYLLLMLLGFFLGRRGAKKKEKKEQRFLEEAV